MTTESIANNIVKQVVTLLSGLDSLKTVTRRPPAQGEFEQFSAAQLPLAVVMGGMPARQEEDPRALNFISALPISIQVFISNNVDPNSEMYDVADDIWAALMTLPRDDRNAYFNGLAQSITAVPQPVQNYAPPYASFGYDLEVTYTHSNKGI